MDESELLESIDHFIDGLPHERDFLAGVLLEVVSEPSEFANAQATYLLFETDFKTWQQSLLDAGWTPIDVDDTQVASGPVRGRYSAPWSDDEVLISASEASGLLEVIYSVFR